jgi:diguanylate cyclase
MVVTHEPWIVALSVLVAVQGSYVGLKIMLGLSEAVGGERRWLLAGTAITLGVAIWSMHFVGMLAVRTTVRIDFLLLPTILSFLICVIVVGLAVYVASSLPRTNHIKAVAAAMMMGAGIVMMHFIAMSAAHSNSIMHHKPLYVVASYLIGVFAAFVALTYVWEGSRRLPLAAASVALGLAISGMHYTAMAGMVLDPLCVATASGTVPTCTIPSLGIAISRDLLAVIVALVAFAVTSAFLLSLVPDGVSPRLATAMAARGVAASLEPQSGEASLSGTSSLSPPDTTPTVKPLPGVLPVQKGGATHYLRIDRILAVKAAAHYCSVFDGQETYFCSLSIGCVEGRLSRERFVRVHRSHIVAIEHVRSLLWPRLTKFRLAASICRNSASCSKRRTDATCNR